MKPLELAAPAQELSCLACEAGLHCIQTSSGCLPNAPAEVASLTPPETRIQQGLGLIQRFRV